MSADAPRPRRDARPPGGGRRPRGPGARPASAAAPLRVVVSDGRGRPLRVPGLAAWLAAVAPRGARGREVAVALVGDPTMRRLNRAFRGRDYATDVLSFPVDTETSTHPTGGRSTGRTFLGDLVIARGVAARQARDAGHPIGAELRVLALHGLLHLLGHDHERDAGTMARLEARLRRKGGLRAGLIGRGRAS